MKKVICFCVSLILMLSCFTAVFADNKVLVYDSFTGELLDGETGQSTNFVTLSSYCTYNKTNKTYIYATSTSVNSDVECSVYDGMVTNSTVSLSAGDGANIAVYRDGELVAPEDYGRLTKVGSYIVRNQSNEQSLFTFTIVGDVTGRINSYQIPSIFYISSASFNGEPIFTNGQTVDLSEEGKYFIDYRCNSTGAVYQLELEMDHTYPQLEIFGIDEEKIAKGPVTFGEMEPESEITMQRNGEYIAISDELKTAGDYIIKYSDKAGNVSSYYFTIKLFFDASSWLYISLFLIVTGLAVGFMIYSRKHMRTR